MYTEGWYWSVLYGAAAVWLFQMWWTDRKRLLAGEEVKGALPGATVCSWTAIIIGVTGALVILGVEVGGEYALDIVDEQSTLPVIFLLSLCGAAIIEEIVFRGYLVIDKRGLVLLLGSILLFSVIFAAIHPFLWQWDDAGFRWNFTVKGWFSFGMTLLMSFWFYAVRFMPWNPQRSLMPCFAAHLAGNVGVFVVKAVQGFIDGWI